MGQTANIKPVQEFRRRLERDFRVERMILFGSRARGTAQTDSDWDVLIVSPNFTKHRFLDRMRRMYRYWDYDHYGAFEPLTYTPKEFAIRSTGPNIVREAVRTGIEIK